MRSGSKGVPGSVRLHGMKGAMYDPTMNGIPQWVPPPFNRLLTAGAPA